MRIDGVCRTVALLSATGVLVCLSAQVGVAEEARQQPAPNAKAPEFNSAAQLVTAALESEAAGNLDQRASLLRDALILDPAYPPAHWHTGEVLVDGEWLSVAQGTAADPRAEQLAHYRKSREAMMPSATDHLRLARYCRDAGLTNQERLHLAMVLQFDPANKEVINKLRTPKRRSDPKAAARQAANIAEAKRARTETYTRWKDQLSRLRDDFDSQDVQRRDAAKARLLAIRDDEAIPALESIVSVSSKDAAQVVVAILEKMPSTRATVSLAKHAVLSESPEIREKAALALKSRDLFAFAPSLLAHMAMPIEVDFDVGSRYGGAVGHRLTLFQEGPDANRSFLSMNIYTPEPVPAVPGSARYGGNVLAPPPPAPGTTDVRSRVTSARPPVEQAAANDASVTARVERFNARSKQVNERIAYVLQTATGTNLPAVPTQWWRWWCNYNEMYYPDEKPIYESGSYVYQPYAYVESYLRTTPLPPPPPPPGTRTRSCFVAGTPVWTQSGPIAVEKLIVGEYVLSQDAQTGELAYRPVVATTVRTPATTLAVQLAGEEILVTRGHPFWVSGTGWRMAKELKAGDLLHTPAGACAIEQISERAEYPTYNLVVVGFNSYFVGQNQVLVHDNNIRGATPTIVPGLSK